MIALNTYVSAIARHEGKRKKPNFAAWENLRKLLVRRKKKKKD